MNMLLCYKESGVNSGASAFLSAIMLMAERSVMKVTDLNSELV